VAKIGLGYVQLMEFQRQAFVMHAVFFWKITWMAAMTGAMTLDVVRFVSHLGQMAAVH
jgi:hypothetical protein